MVYISKPRRLEILAVLLVVVLALWYVDYRRQFVVLKGITNITFDPSGPTTTFMFSSEFDTASIAGLSAVATTFTPDSATAAIPTAAAFISALSTLSFQPLPPTGDTSTALTSNTPPSGASSMPAMQLSGTGSIKFSKLSAQQNS